MKTKIGRVLIGMVGIALSPAGPGVSAQSVAHPWHVVDQGGGRSASGGFAIRASIGQPAILSGESAGMSLESGYVPALGAFDGGTGDVTLEASEGWNLLSVPVVVEDFRRFTLYPTAVSAAFDYAGSYQPRDTLRNGAGYWIKFDSFTGLAFSGDPVAVESVDVRDRWNIVGALTTPIPVAQISAIPPVTIASAFFGYSAADGYAAADTLFPGNGYWVKVANTGRLVISTAAMVTKGAPGSASSGAVSVTPGQTPKAAPPGTARIDTLTIVDAAGGGRTLLFSASPSAGDPLSDQLPPIPPAGILDVRFATDLRFASADPATAKEATIKISAARYPVTLRWSAGSTEDGVSLLVDGREISLSGTGTAGIAVPPATLKLRLPAAGPIRKAVPTGFALSQNYPNPFNPSTRIPYELAAGGRVSIIVFNLLGEVVATLVDEIQDAGYRSIEWNAADVPGGVYLCRMRAPGYESARKLILIK